MKDLKRMLDLAGVSDSGKAQPLNESTDAAMARIQARIDAIESSEEVAPVDCDMEVAPVDMGDEQETSYDVDTEIDEAEYNIDSSGRPVLDKDARDNASKFLSKSDGSTDWDNITVGDTKATYDKKERPGRGHKAVFSVEDANALEEHAPECEGNPDLIQMLKQAGIELTDEDCGHCGGVAHLPKEETVTIAVDEAPEDFYAKKDDTVLDYDEINDPSASYDDLSAELAQSDQEMEPNSNYDVHADGMLNQIEYMQNQGMSSAVTHYDVDKLSGMDFETIKDVFAKVMGQTIAEEDANNAGPNGYQADGDNSDVEGTEYDATDLFPSGQTTNSVKQVSNTGGRHSDNPMATVDPVEVSEEASELRLRIEEAFKAYNKKK